MIDGDGNTCMAFGLCTNLSLRNNRLEKQLQYFLSKNYYVKKALMELQEDT